MTIETIPRTINYYYLNCEFLDDFNPENQDKFCALFDIITTLSKTRAGIRYQPFGEKYIFIQDVKVVNDRKIIQGKLRCI